MTLRLLPALLALVGGSAAADGLVIAFPPADPAICVVATSDMVAVRFDAALPEGLSRIDMLAVKAEALSAWQVSPFDVPGLFVLEGFEAGTAIIFDPPLRPRQARFDTLIADGPGRGPDPVTYAFSATDALGAVVPGPLVTFAADASGCGG